MDTLIKHRSLRHAPPALSGMEAAARAADIVSSLAIGQGINSSGSGGMELNGMIGKEAEGAPMTGQEDGSQLLGSDREISGAREAGAAVGGPATEKGVRRGYEYVTWFFTPEEEARRQAYLPLK